MATSIVVGVGAWTVSFSMATDQGRSKMGAISTLAPDLATPKTHASKLGKDCTYIVDGGG
jgi:hypothetical protein